MTFSTSRVNGEGRAYYPISDNITFVGRAIGGHIEGWGGDDVRLTDLYYRGGETIRGFDRGGFGPRDLVHGRRHRRQDLLGGHGEIRFPLPYVPDDLGLSGAVFADAGSLFDANDLAKSLNGKANGIVARRRLPRPFVGRRLHHVELTGRPDPHGLRQGNDEGRLRQGAVLPLRRLDEVLRLRRFGEPAIEVV